MKFAILFLFTFFIFNTSYATDFQFRVIDELKAPIANVIIKVPSELIDEDSLAKSKHDIAIMDQINSQFSPHVLLINSGQSVSFPNRDDIRHHVYSFSKAKPFKIKLYKNTPSEPIEFEQAGVVELGCNIHDQMLGYIYVSDNAYAVKTDPLGEALVSTKSNNALSTIQLWHPQLSTARTEHIEMQLPEPNEKGEYVLTLALIEKNQVKENNTFKKKFGKR